MEIQLEFNSNFNGKPVGSIVNPVEIPIIYHWKFTAVTALHGLSENRNKASQPYETFCTLSLHQNTHLGSKKTKKANTYTGTPSKAEFLILCSIHAMKWPLVTAVNFNNIHLKYQWKSIGN